MKLTSRALITGLLLLASSVYAAGPAKPVVPHVDKPAFPQLNLPDRESAGQRAVDLLGSRLPEVAAFYRKSPDEFRALLLNDRSMRLDQRGRLFVVEELNGPLAPQPVKPASKPSGAITGAAIAAAGASSPGVFDGSLAPLDQTFLLHSRPGAQRTVYLNFKGAALTGTAWNSNPNGAGTTITALPFDTDGLPYSFSTSELQKIQYIWQRVAEDFASFDVNVTTEAPPADMLSRTDASDVTFGTTALITSSVGVYNCSCGGVAYVSAFDDTSDYYKPALVFYDRLGPGSEKYVAEAISHEVGHNLGLSHDGTFDGTTTVGYYQGHGSGVTGWAPVMGVGYYQALTQWSKGEYLKANNTQDDFAVMQSRGLPLRVDDHGDTAATATVLTGASSGGVTSFAQTGVIERSTDVDVFAFSAGAGPVNLTLTPAVRSANLDGVLTLSDAAGTVIASSNPVDALNGAVSATLPAAGTYFISVRGTGKGDPLTTGYSSYGSVGLYTLTGNFYATGNVAPTAVIAATPTTGSVPLTVNFSGAGSTDPDGSITNWLWTFHDGTTASGATVARVYETAGTYIAQLQVTDNGGLTATKSTTITVGAALVNMNVGNIGLTLTVAKSGTATVTAAVSVRDGNGAAVSGATVTGNWSGLVNRTGVAATTGSNGIASFTSPASARNVRGVFTFTVTAVAKTGYSYLPASNAETSDSITR